MDYHRNGQDVQPTTSIGLHCDAFIGLFNPGGAHRRNRTIPPYSQAGMEDNQINCLSNTNDNQEKEEVVKTTLENRVEDQQNVKFVDQDPTWVQGVESSLDHTFNLTDSNDVSLSQFLSRPVLIFTSNWYVSSNTGTDDGAKLKSDVILNPWYKFFTNPHVRDKIKNFKLLRCKLKVKFVVNGTGFQYGMKAVTYTPLWESDPAMGAAHNADYITGFDNTPLFTLLSQKPKLFLSAGDSQGGVMELPFIWYANYVDIPSKQFSKLGAFQIIDINQLRSVGANIDTHSCKCHFSVFAWAEDVELILPTVQEPTPTAQAGDEYSERSVSAIANSVAASTGALSKIPVIGPYMRASSMLSSAVGSAAKLLGFSRPTILTDTAPYKPVYFGNMANTGASDTSAKLTFDGKQEVSIDPRITGLSSTDEMQISAIAGKESYIGTFDWQVDYGINKRLMQTSVTPMIWNTNSTDRDVDLGKKSKLYLTSCAFVSLPFRMWRGTMRYRFQVVASQFHRGRLRIVWDPKSLPGTNFVSTNTNVVYSAVIDLADSRDFYIDVAWGQQYLFSEIVDEILPKYGCVKPITVCSFQPNKSGTRLPYGNGQLAVYVLNELVIPAMVSGGAATEVAVNVYMSCPDLQLAMPDADRIAYISPTEPTPYMAGETPVAQAGFEEANVMNMAPSTASTVMRLGPPPPSGSMDLYAVNFGDPICSIRALMKRYCFYTAYPLAGISYINKVDGTDAPLNLPTAVEHALNLPDQPTPLCKDGYGNMYIVGAIDTSNAETEGQGVWMVKTVPMTYFTLGYLCRRGGVRWKYNAPTLQGHDATWSTPNVGDNGFLQTMSVTRGSADTVPYINALCASTTSDTFRSGGCPLALLALESTDSGMNGMMATPTPNNPVLEIELPFYTQKRFAAARTYTNWISKSPTVPPPTGTVNQMKTKWDNWWNPRLAIVPANTDTVNRTPAFHKLHLSGVASQSLSALVKSYVAAADDYSLSFYMGPPVLYNWNGLAFKTNSQYSLNSSLLAGAEPGIDRVPPS